MECRPPPRNAKRSHKSQVASGCLWSYFYTSMACMLRGVYPVMECVELPIQAQPHNGLLPFFQLLSLHSLQPRETTMSATEQGKIARLRTDCQAGFPAVWIDPRLRPLSSCALPTGGGFPALGLQLPAFPAFLSRSSDFTHCEGRMTLRHPYINEELLKAPTLLSLEFVGRLGVSRRR